MTPKPAPVARYGCAIKPVDDWRNAVAQRRAEIKDLFDKRGMRPFFVQGAFDAEALSRYFLEAAA